MRSYPFIKELFGNVLSKSIAIDGRFHLLTRANGSEINSDTFNGIIKDVVKPVDGKKWPAALMLPPRSLGNLDIALSEWDQYIITLFFLTTTYYTSNNQVKTPNTKTLTSMHTIDEDWHDMRRCAVNFFSMLSKVIRVNQLQKDQVRIVNEKHSILPVSEISEDRVSGVRLDFKIDLFSGCTFEDYSEEDVSDVSGIIIPAADTHPQHNL